MNRMMPCDQCGCPILFHVPRTGTDGVRRMVCEECSKKTRTEVVCGVES